MKATCYDVKCTFQMDNVCSRFPINKTCVVSGLDIIPDKDCSRIKNTEIKKTEEYEIFKDFLIQFRREINANEVHNGGNGNFAMGFKIVQHVGKLVTAITSDDTEEMKKELLKICTIAYKMWRNLN